MKNVQINGNGDNPKVLQQQLRDAHDALVVAEEKIRAITIHGRNYQTLPMDKRVDAFTEDVDAKSKLATKVCDVQLVLRGWHLVIAKQIKK